MTARILGVGAAAPRFRLPAAEVATAWGRTGGRGQAAVCAPDEDPLTLAAEAAGRALVAAGVGAGRVGGCWWGTTRPPFAEGPSQAVLAAAVGVPGEAGGALCAGSPHAGLDAFNTAVDAVLAGSAQIGLVVASDALLPGPGTAYEARCGAGAIALVIGRGDDGATVGPRVTRARPFLDRYRGDADRETRDLYDARLFREEVFLPLVTEVAEQLATLEPTAWSLPDPDGRLGAALARRLGGGTPPSAAAYAQLGDAAAAMPLLGAALALDAEGTVAVVGQGGGRATGLTLRADAPVPGAALVADWLADGEPISYTTALRARRLLVPTGETIPMGTPPESAQFVRGADEMLGLLGARCVDCATVSTPPSIHPRCVGCGGPKLEPVSLARHGVVHTFVVNQTMPAPFEAPLPLAVVDLDDGARIMLQVVGDGADVAIGAEVDLVLRRYSYERGVPTYGWKAQVVQTGRASRPTATRKVLR